MVPQENSFHYVSIMDEEMGAIAAHLPSHSQSRWENWMPTLEISPDKSTEIHSHTIIFSWIKYKWIGYEYLWEISCLSFKWLNRDFPTQIGL